MAENQVGDVDETMLERRWRDSTAMGMVPPLHVLPVVWYSGLAAHEGHDKSGLDEAKRHIVPSSRGSFPTERLASQKHRRPRPASSKIRRREDCEIRGWAERGMPTRRSSHSTPRSPPPSSSSPLAPQGSSLSSSSSFPASSLSIRIRTPHLPRPPPGPPPIAGEALRLYCCPCPPAGTSWPALVRLCESQTLRIRPWAVACGGGGGARGRRAGTAGGGSGPVCSALPVRLGIRRSEAHTAAVVDAVGMVGMRTGMAVYGLWGGCGTGRCGGQGGGRICIRRQRGAQGSGRSIQDETR
ncbi:hypothetical protein B0H13DRAFT_2294911 [Mycena leptocephala]|nr:hypothetical protein B0H13DRAFT_2294911 [Mycena leptocephala]